MPAARRAGGRVATIAVTSFVFRQPVFVGDLVDRGPGIPQVLKLVMGMVEAGAVAARDQPSRLLPWRAIPGDRGPIGQRAHVRQPLHQDPRPVGQSTAQIARGDRLRHRQIASQQFTQQTELDEAAHVLRAAPQMLVAVETPDHAAAQILPQHAGAMRGVDEPGAAAATAVDALRAFAPCLGIEPARIGLPQLRAVEQNGPVRARLSARAIARRYRRQALGGIESAHRRESIKP